jgi:8-oxo-dGTP diphosphatase
MKSIHVVAALISDKNRFLIGKRSTGKFTGFWEFPGGKVEEKETPEIALLREIKEEFGVELSIKKLLVTIDHQYPDFMLRMDCFLCTVDTVKFHLNDHSEISWFDPMNDKDEKNWLPADIKVVEYLKNTNLNDFL